MPYMADNVVIQVDISSIWFIGRMVRLHGKTMQGGIMKGRKCMNFCSFPMWQEPGTSRLQGGLQIHSAIELCCSVT